MIIEADAFQGVELTEDGAIARVLFSVPGQETVEIRMPVQRLENGLPEMRRIVEAVKLRGTTTTGFERVVFSPAKSIEPRADVTALRLYLFVDKGLPNQVTYSIPLPKAASLAGAIATEVQKWMDAISPASKQ